MFEIIGNPEPQKKTRFGKGRAWNPSKLKEQQIQWQIRAHAPKEPLRGPVTILITFLMPIPKATSAPKRRHMINNTLCHVVRPDVDNLSYLVVNAMKEIIYADDSQIVDLHVIKRYGEEPKTIVQVTELQNMVSNEI